VKVGVNTMNVAVVVGKIGKKPILRYAKSSLAYSVCHLVTYESTGKVYMNVVAFGPEAEKLSAAQTGDLVLIHGRISVYVKKSSRETQWRLLANRVRNLSAETRKVAEESITVEKERAAIDEGDFAALEDSPIVITPDEIFASGEESSFEP